MKARGRRRRRRRRRKKGGEDLKNEEMKDIED